MSPTATTRRSPCAASVENDSVSARATAPARALEEDTGLAALGDHLLDRLAHLVPPRHDRRDLLVAEPLAESALQRRHVECLELGPVVSLHPVGGGGAAKV